MSGGKGTNKTRRGALVIALGIYLFLCADYEGVVAFANLPLPNPLFGLMGFLIAHLRSLQSPTNIALVAGIVSLVHLGIAVSCFLKRPLLKLYLAVATLISAPMVFAAGSLIVTGGADMFSPQDGVEMLKTITIFSLVPMGLAVWILVLDKTDG